MEDLNKIAEELGLAGRMHEELQFLALDFRGVDLEGIEKFEDELQVFDRDSHILIRSRWEEKLARNPRMFPGPLASVIDFRVRDGILELRLQRSRFDIYDGLRERVPSKLNLDQRPLDSDFSLPLSMGAVTITDPDDDNPEGCIIFGIRSKSTAFGEGQSSTLPSGFYNPDSDRLVMGDPELHNWLMSIRFTALKEAREEIGIHDYRSLEYLGFIQDCDLSKQPLIAMRLRLDFTVKEIRAIVQDVGHEVESYHFVPNNIADVREFVDRHPPTPHNVAKLILHFATS